MDTVNSFVSKFCQWVKPGYLPEKSRHKLPQSLRCAIDVKLVDDDQRREIVVRQLAGSGKLYCEFSAEDLWVYRAETGWLEVGDVGPGWRRGWQDFDKDEHIADLISGFFHFAGQYVHRGRAASIIGAIAATYDKAWDFRHGRLESRYVDNDEVKNVERKSLIRAKYFSPTAIRLNSRSRQFITWVNCINGLDPYIQRAVYYFWRATSLMESDFFEESVTALDKLTSVAASFLQNRLSIPDRPRAQLVEKFHMGHKDSDNLDLLYKLRNNYGAHPSGSKWWDFADIYCDDIDDMRQTSRKLLWQLCKAERDFREVEPFPATWSTWFRQNALMLFDSVWFSDT